MESDGSSARFRETAMLSASPAEGFIRPANACWTLSGDALGLPAQTRLHPNASVLRQYATVM